MDSVEIKVEYVKLMVSREDKISASLSNLENILI
jgi:hypothetical protein